jgi:hypothetical protein
MTALPSVRRSAAVLLTLVALGACSGALDERVREQFHSTIEAGPRPVVRIDNVAGTVRVDGWPRDVVDVEATKYAYDAQELRTITISVRPEEGGVAIVTTHLPGVRGGVHYRIHVPVAAALDVSNVAGAIDISGVAGNLDVVTQAGEITADAGLVAGDRSIDLHATTGAITLSVAPASSASVEAESTVGAFSSDFPGVAGRRENVVGERGDGTIGSGSASIRLTTTTGAIGLRER